MVELNIQIDESVSEFALTQREELVGLLNEVFKLLSTEEGFTLSQERFIKHCEELQTHVVIPILEDYMQFILDMDEKITDRLTDSKVAKTRKDELKKLYIESGLHDKANQLIHKYNCMVGVV